MSFPRIYRIRQPFDNTAVKDIPASVKAELTGLSLEKKVKPGQKVAVTAGSRGVANIAEILKATVGYLKSIGAEPFIFPAMGSHGGAKAEEQTALLAHYQVTEAFTGAPIVSSMEVIEISRTEDGVPVYIDKNASDADWVVVVNRVKPHTKFKAPIESGLMKMMAIGMGKQKGAEHYHKAAIQYTFGKIIVDAGREVIKKAPILCGIAIVENGYDETARIKAIEPQDFEEQEKELLVVAKELMPRLPFNDIDLLIIDEMGKNISGTGMDPNIIGRNRDILGAFPHPVNPKRIFVRDLTDDSNGNATGIGLADLATKRLVDKIDYQATYMNCITGISLEKAAIPMNFKTDSEAIQVGLGSIGLVTPENAQIVRIKNTLQVDEAEVSEAYTDELEKREDLEIVEGPSPMAFDAEGNLPPLEIHRT